MYLDNTTTEHVVYERVSNVLLKLRYVFIIDIWSANVQEGAE